jgi:hypothetical protein
MCFVLDFISIFLFLSNFDITQVGTSQITSCLFYIYGHGIINLSNFTVTGLSCSFSSSYGIIYPSFDCELTLNNVSFNNISCSSSTPVVYHCADDYMLYKVNFNNCSFTNISSSGTGGTIGLCLNYFSSNGTINGCIFSNITGLNGYNGGAIRIALPYYSYYSGNITITSTYFVNIKVKGNGGAIYDSTAKLYSITSSNFTNCSTTDGSGGAIYVQSSGRISFYTCRFDNNFASSSYGNDIGYGSDSSYSLYSSAYVVSTCSGSNLPRTSFPSGNNIDNFFFGMKEFFFLFFVLYFLFFLSVLFRVVICFKFWNRC